MSLVDFEDPNVQRIIERRAAGLRDVIPPAPSSKRGFSIAGQARRPAGRRP
jgi:hypothetical protein